MILFILLILGENDPKYLHIFLIPNNIYFNLVIFIIFLFRGENGLKIWVKYLCKIWYFQVHFHPKIKVK